MIRYFINIVLLICLLGGGWFISGCSDREQKQQQEYLIKVGDSILTVADFNKAFEIAKAAYSYDIMQDPEAIKQAMLRLVEQMTEEMIILERAKEIGVTATSSEVGKAMADIKRDYPGNEFQNSLVENAVPYPSWEQALKRRLLMDKVIAKDLGDQILITPDDISKYYQTHSDDFPVTSDPKAAEASGATPSKASDLKAAESTPSKASDMKATESTPSKASDLKEKEKDRHDAIVKLLRREKMEKAYAPWIESLKKKYPVEINEEKLKKLTDLQQIRKHLAS